MKTKKVNDIGDSQPAFQTVVDKFNELKLSVARDAFIAQSKEPAYYGMDFAERLALILQPELLEKKKRRTERLLKESKIDDKTVSMENIIYSDERHLDQALMKELAKGRWLENERKSWFVITGKAGTGKTFIAKSLLKQALELGYKGKYIRANHLFDELELAREEKRISKYKESFNKYKVLLVDDFNFQIVSEQVLEDFLDLIDIRYERAFLIITSQFPMDDWYANFQSNKNIVNKTRADAIMDRIVNSIQCIELKGSSMRERRKV